MTVDRSHTIKVYSEAELAKLIYTGMSIAEVTNTFGLPGSEVEFTGNIILLTYMFPLEAQRSEGAQYLAGFGIDIKEGRVINWSPVIGTTGKATQGGGTQGAFGEQTFKIFLVDDSLMNLVTTVESEGSADASNLKNFPGIVFKAKVFAGSSGSERPGEQTVILVVSEQDASRLKDLSENGLGKRLLIVSQDYALAAPVINAPLTSRQLRFTVKDPQVLNLIKPK